MDFQRYTIDANYDKSKNDAAEAFIAPYKHAVDSIMSPVVGRAAHDMTARRPESLLSNFLTDILVASGSQFGEKPDLGIYNIGGIRASISKGDITVGDIIDVAPFENKLCFLTLTGKDLTSLFEQIAARHGEGVSKEVKAVITKDGKLVSLLIKGQPVNPEAKYRIATIDYVAQGNDQMTAFKLGTNLVADDDPKNNSRFIIRDYFLRQQAKGQIIDAKVEGRITIKK